MTDQHQRLLWRFWMLLVWACVAVFVFSVARASWRPQDTWRFDGDPTQCDQYGVYWAPTPQGPWEKLALVPQQTSDGTECYVDVPEAQSDYVVFVPMYPDGKTHIGCIHGNQPWGVRPLP